ncbi:MAG: TIGR01906 family membrane protein [Dehalococcoidia bacterium]|nr:TIGR01906 family membrane protein [Dehalococcoidia bacterium]
MKVTVRVAQVVFIIFLPIFLFTASIGVAFNSPSLYSYGFDKYDISTVTGISPLELNKAARALISYWNSGEEYVNVTVEKDEQSFTLFNEREVVHLKDVKDLVRLDYIALVVTGLYSLVYAAFALWYRRPAYRRDLAAGGLSGGILSMGILAVVGVIALVDFGGFWQQFHLLSFTNDLWLLDPSRDYLIMMFPEGFWFDSVLIVAGLTACLALIIGGLSWFYLKNNRGRQ